MGAERDPLLADVLAALPPDAAAAIESLQALLRREAPGERRAALAAELASRLLRAGRFADAHTTAVTEIEAAPPAATARLCAHVAAASLHLGDLTAALRAAIEAEERAVVADDTWVRLAAIATQGDVLALLGRVEESIATSERGLEVAASAGRDEGRAMLLGQLARTRRRSGDLAGSMHAHLEAVELHRRGSRLRELALDLGNVALACTGIGAPEDGVRYAQEGLAAAVTVGEPHLRWNLERTLSHALQTAGRAADAVEHARAAMGIAQQTGSEDLLASAGERLGAALVAAGELEEAGDVLSRALVLARDRQDAWLQVSACIGLVEVHLGSGDLGAAGDAAEDGWALLERAADPVLEAELHRVTSVLHERRGDPAEALRHARRHHALRHEAAARAADERLAELRLRHEGEQAERQLRAAFESLPEAVLLVRPGGTIEHANAGAERMFGCARGALSGSRLDTLIPVGARQAAADHVRRFFESPMQRVIPRTLTALRADGTEFPAEIAVGVVRTREATLALCSIRDVSKLRRAESDLRSALGVVEDLRRRLEKENVILREELESHHGFEEIVGSAPPVRDVLRQVEQVAPMDATVLLLGETGTGKELFARAIHSRSERRAEPLVTVNCAALPESLIESELFGHVAGSFTGALGDRVGRFEMADGGTIFLDEIGDLPLAMQAKLLRVLQDGDVQRVGSADTRRVDVRVLAATNRDLSAMVADGTFRADLFYRLNVFPIRLPPLRERASDIPLLVWFFVQRCMRRMGKVVDRIPDDVMLRFRSYEWPGNVRELQNVVERSVILSGDGVLRWDAPRAVATPTSRAAASRLEDVERAHVVEVLEQCGWRVKGAGGAADVLDLNPSTLRSRMAKLGITRPGR